MEDLNKSWSRKGGHKKIGKEGGNCAETRKTVGGHQERGTGPLYGRKEGKEIPSDQSSQGGEERRPLPEVKTGGERETKGDGGISRPLTQSRSFQKKKGTARGNQKSQFVLANRLALHIIKGTCKAAFPTPPSKDIRKRRDSGKGAGNS